MNDSSLTRRARAFGLVASASALLLHSLACGSLDERDFSGPPSDGGSSGGSSSSGGASGSGGATSSAGSSGEASCGNGRVEDGEECDSESEPCAYGETCEVCNADCQYEEVRGPYCGDGETNGDEECDGGEACTDECAARTTCDPAADECGPDQYCDAPSCGSPGYCAPRPTSTSNIHVPACGCNGTNYWNETHARSLGATAFATGSSAGCATPEARACSSDAGCPAAGSFCLLAYGLSCNGANQGRCWSKPATATCAGGLFSDDIGFEACDGSTPQCSTDCMVRLNGKTYRTSCL